MDRFRAVRMTQELAGTAVGGWTVGKYLGNGASGLVVRAEKDGQQGALKIIDPEIVERHGEAQQLARVERERDLTGHKHPYLVKILDGGTCVTSGYLFLVMELLDMSVHMTLTEAVATLPRERIRPLIGQIADAARFLLEDHGLAHRDIKPDNIMIARDFSRAILLDLGVARPLAPSADAGTGDAFVGTTRYSPPEYVFRREEDTPEGWRSVTFYQLGAVLHDMVMRRPIFCDVQAPAAAVIEAVLNRTPMLDVLDVEQHLVSIARWCLEKDWRLRLRLVDWRGFSEAPPAANPAVAKERLRSRMQLTRHLQVDAQDGYAAPSRRVLERLGAEFAEFVRRICTESEVFPPVDIRPAMDDGVCHVHLEVGPALLHSLAGVLVVCLEIELMGERNGLVSVRAAARYGAVVDGLPQEGWTQVFQGEQSAVELQTGLDAYLHGILDRATEIVAVPPGGIVLHLGQAE